MSKKLQEEGKKRGRSEKKLMSKKQTKKDVLKRRQP